MGSKQSLAKKSSKHHASNSIQNKIVIKEKVILLGTSDVGKSTFFNTWKRLYTNLERQSHDTFERDLDFEKDLHKVCSWILENVWLMMSESERDQLKNILPEKFKSRFENTQMLDGIWKDCNCGLNCSELLVYLWKIAFFRDFYQMKWDITSSQFGNYDNENFYNVEELIRKIESRRMFNPLSLIYPRSYGISVFSCKGKNTEISMVDVGGRRSERRKWISVFEGAQTVVYMASLSEFDQYLVEDGNSLRIQESTYLFDEISNSRWFLYSRKVLLFTKPDILVKKLQKGIQYKGELDFKIRSELEGISQHHVKVVINSIISEHLKKVRTQIDSFHILNVTSEEEVAKVCDFLFDKKSKQTFISKFLYSGGNTLQLKLQHNYLKGNLTDIQIHFTDL